MFSIAVGTELDAANIRRDCRRVVDRTPGLNSAEWTPRETRHSFVSLLSEGGLSIEKIPLLVGHKSTQVTETVYRRQLRPVLTEEQKRWTDCYLRAGRHSGRGKRPSP